MRRYYITDRKLAGGIEPLLNIIERNLQLGVEMIQIREKDLSGRELTSLVRRVLALPNPHGVRVLVNERVDVALAAGAHGVHLPSNAVPAGEFRRIVPAGFLLGVSCHYMAELIATEREGADLAVFGPVFTPLSKATQATPKGLEALRSAAKMVSIPVFALGGITEENAPSCIAAGAAGIAAITLFQK